MRDGYKALLFLAAYGLAYILAPSAYLRYEVVYFGAVSLAVLGVTKLLDAGLVNFGYGMYVAAGAYAAGLLYKHLGVSDVAAGVALAAAAGAAFGYAVGKATARFRGIFYALLNLSISMVLYGVLVKFYTVTGGSDGITIPTYLLFGFPAGTDAIAGLTAALAATGLYMRSRYLRSALYYNALGLRENELRMRALAVSPEAAVVKLTVFSAIFGSVSGALLAYLTNHVSPDLSFWSESSIMVIGGLAGGFISPMYGFLAGALVLRTLDILASYSVYELVVGMGLMLIFALALARSYVGGARG